MTVNGEHAKPWVLESGFGGSAAVSLYAFPATPSAVCATCDAVRSPANGLLLIKRQLLVAEDKRRRRGLGARLMAQAEAWTRARSCHGVWLDTSSANTERFYARLGYKPFGILENAEDERPAGHHRAFRAKRFA